MDYSPINEMIDRAANRKVAQSVKAKAKRTKALNDQVLSLVHAANETALPERHVTPRAALIVMARAMKELASLPEESRNHGVLREVTKFISLSQKTLLASVSTKHADLLPAGHPLSPLNASLSDVELRKKYAEWIAADPAIADEARPLVAMAHSLPPESIEREHAFLRLRALQASAVPAYFKIDDVTALVASFRDGNSSAARRARVALQWRDRIGRWVEMGRGVNFRFRLPDGSIQVGRGNYVGAGGETRIERTDSGTSLVSDFGLIEVSGVPGLNPGLYVINSNNAVVYKARIPGFAAPVGPSFKDQFDQDIPSIADLTATRMQLPIGWKNQGAFYTSDDNYGVIPAPNGQPQTVLRLNENGQLGRDVVARVRNWSEVNAAIEKDQPEFDKEIARLESDKLPLGRIPGATDKDVVDAADILRMQEQRAKENEAFDAAEPAPEKLGNKDLNGNVVPEGWTRDADNDSSYTRQMPLRDGGTYPVIARLNEDGTYTAGSRTGWIPEPGTDGRGPSRKFKSWDEIETEGLPGLVKYLNETFTKDNPIEFTPAAKETKNVKGFDVPKDAKLVAMEQNGDAVVVSMPDGSLVQYDTGGPEGLPFTEEQKQKFISDIKSDETIWFDEEGKRNWKALLGDQATKNVNGFDVPKDSTLVAMEQNGDAIVVQMPNGDLVQYDTGGPEGLPLSKEQADKFISDIKSGESIWFDENGRTKFEALLKGEGGSGQGEQPAGMELDFADPEKAAEEAGLPKDAPLKDIVNAWFNQNIKPVAPTAKLDAVEQGALMPVIRISADNEKDLLNAFKVYSGDDKATLEDLRDSSEEYVPGTRDETSIAVPADSVTIARDRDDLAVIVRMPDGSWVEYDNNENVSPISDAERKKLIKDFKGEENIRWRDENGQMFFTEALKDNGGSGPGEPPSGPTGGDTPGSGFADYVIDLAEDNADLGRDLEELLDGDAAEAGIELMDQIYEDASDRYELSQDIADNKPEGMSNDEFVKDAVAKMREQLSAIVDSAIEERRDLEDDPKLKVDFDKKAFVDSAAQRFEELLREELDNVGEDDEGPDEPPSPGGGTPPKAPSPSTPGSPALFKDFDAPAGAFQLRTTEYEPEGRIDEASTDFTDDPRRLATKFTLNDLITAFTEALIGRPDDNAMQDILNANVDDEGDLPDLADLADVADSNAPRANANNASGAGALEFNAGEEYVPAEALYNAVYEAGGDPNRVIANAYDAVNGNRDNVQKLLDAQGGVSSPEDAQLIEDMTDEIRQIKDATPDDEISAINKRSTPEKKFAGSLIENVPVDYDNPDYFDMDSDAYIPAQPEIDENGYTDNPEILALDYESADLIEQMLEGITDGSGVALLDFSDGDKYMEGVHEVPVEALRDALQMQGINTNEILFKLRDESNDMSEEEPKPEQPSGMPEQIFNQKIKDKNGSEFELNLIKIGDVYEGALINKGNDRIQIIVRDSSEREAKKVLREAGTYIKQAANGDEAMDDGFIPNLDRVVEEPVAPEAPSARPARESSEGFSPFSDAADELDDTVDSGVIDNLDKSADTIVSFFGANIDGMGFLAFSSSSGEIVVRSNDSRIFKVKPNGVVTDVNIDPSTAEAFYAETGSAFGWEPIPQDVMDAIFAESIRRFPDAVRAPEPTPEGAPESPAQPEAPATPAPAFTYPGPREAGYTVNNTTIASDGAVIGAGSIVIANRDGKRGVVVSIQNDPEYARIRFEDGKIAVRSANQIKAVSNPDGTLAMLPSGAAQPSGAVPSTDVESRLDAPVRPAPSIARTGSAWGVNDASEVPDFIKPLVQENVSQSDFSAWGERDAEIAKAASTRATLDALIASVDKYEAARKNGEEASVLRELKEETNKILKDVYGGRDGLSFGVDEYKVNVMSSYSSSNSRTLANGKQVNSYSFNISFYLYDKNGKAVGEGSRSIAIEDSTDENGNPVRKSSAKNDILKVYGANKKKGFASAYNRYMENWYIANGIDKVKVMAAGGGSWQGAFVWALNGFDWENPDAARSMISALTRAAKTPEEREIAKKLADKVDAANGDPNKVPTPLEIALAGWYPGAKKWFGKDVIIERTWHGVKHLNPTAREQVQSVNYNQIKNAERRIQAGQNKPGTSAVGLAQVMDNGFQTNNPELGPYIDQIRDVLKNNRPLGFLSPAAKSALSKYVSKELLNKNSGMPMEDLFRLRTALASEYRAENDYADPFAAIGNALAGFTVDDFEENSDRLKAAGFSAKSLTGDESGVNSTFMVTHKESGQVFFVKEEKLSRNWNSARGLISEVEANTIMNALEMMGVPNVRGSNQDSDIIIMSQAGATLPLAAPVENASTMMNYGIKDADGDIYASDSSANFVDVLKNPEDVFNMAIVDMLGAGGDRHDGNWMAAFDRTDNRLFMFPIDNSLLTVNKDYSGVEDFFISTWPDAGDVYQQAVPRIIRSAGEERAAEMFMNQVRKLINNLDNPLFQPKGEELAALIDKWGSYEAFKDELKKRLTTIVTPGSAENKALINSMKISNWR